MVTLKKYHGLGNDYLIYDPNQNRELLQERQIQLLCRRNTGVGADGILFGPVLENEKIKVRIFNPDGSEAERSGNGIRIFSKYLKDAGYVKEKCYELWTKAGPVQVEFLDEDASRMKVDMGYAAFGADSIHAVGFEGDMINESVFFCDNFYNITCVSMGNPNCVVMMEEISKNKALHLGPYVENSKYFPNRINMQLCHVVDRENIQIEIYERGAGYTYASGTGACAAASAAHKLGLVGNHVQVHMQGGDLLVEFAEDDRVFMTGPVVYIGSITLAENFDHPYFATSIQDFWHRWHMSLSSWLRDYVYIPLGGNRKGKLRKYVNILLTFLVSGLWHGMGLTYLVWGFLHGLYQIIGSLLMPVRDRLVSLTKTDRSCFSHRLLKQLCTFFLVMLAWIFFRADSVTQALQMIRQMAVFNPWVLWNQSVYLLGLDAKNVWILFFAIAILLLVSILQTKTDIRVWLAKQGIVFRYAVVYLALFAVLIFGIYGPGYDAVQFIYGGF